MKGSKFITTNEETRRMFRFDEDEISRSRDGLTFDGQGTTVIANFHTKMAEINNQELWNNKSTAEAGLAKFNKGVDSAAGLVCWITKTNKVKDWVNAGRDMTQLLMELPNYELSAHPLNQAIHECKAMGKVKIKLEGPLKIEPIQKNQMIVRIDNS